MTCISDAWRTCALEQVNILHSLIGSLRFCFDPLINLEIFTTNLDPSSISEKNLDPTWSFIHVLTQIYLSFSDLQGSWVPLIDQVDLSSQGLDL